MTGDAEKNYYGLLAAYKSKHGAFPSLEERKEMKAAAVLLAFEDTSSEIIDEPRERIPLKVTEGFVVRAYCEGCDAFREATYRRGVLEFFDSGDSVEGVLMAYCSRCEGVAVIDHASLMKAYNETWNS